MKVNTAPPPPPRQRETETQSFTFCPKLSNFEAVNPEIRAERL